jgi:hypothetical protein
MFVSSSLAQPIVALFFALPFNNLLHNLLLQIVRARDYANFLQRLRPCVLSSQLRRMTAAQTDYKCIVF